MKPSSLMYKNEIWSAVKFMAVGCANVLLDILIYTICYRFIKLPVYQAHLMGITFGLISSYILNRTITFKSDEPFFGTALFKFALLSLVCVPASSIGINYMDASLNLGPWVSKFLVTAIVGVFNYSMSRLFVFRSLRQRKPVRWLMDSIYKFNGLVRRHRWAQMVLIAGFSISVDICMYFYLTYVGLDSYKAQPICVVGGLVCCYLLALKFYPYRIEHFVGFFFVSVFTVMICSPIMYVFEIRFGLNALFAKIPATACISALVLVLCRWIVYRDVFKDE